MQAPFVTRFGHIRALVNGSTAPRHFSFHVPLDKITLVGFSLDCLQKEHPSKKIGDLFWVSFSTHPTRVASRANLSRTYRFRNRDLVLASEPHSGFFFRV